MEQSKQEQYIYGAKKNQKPLKPTTKTRVSVIDDHFMIHLLERLTRREIF